jgi:hypothetical protein
MPDTGAVKSPPDGEPQELYADLKAIIIAIGGSAFCASLFGFYEEHHVLGTIFGLGGLVTMAPISRFVRSRVGWAFSRPALLALGGAMWLLLAVDIGLKIWPRPSVPPTRRDISNRAARIYRERLFDCRPQRTRL